MNADELFQKLLLIDEEKRKKLKVCTWDEESNDRWISAEEAVCNFASGTIEIG